MEPTFMIFMENLRFAQVFAVWGVGEILGEFRAVQIFPLLLARIIRQARTFSTSHFPRRPWLTVYRGQQVEFDPQSWYFSESSISRSGQSWHQVATELRLRWATIRSGWAMLAASLPFWIQLGSFWGGSGSIFSRFWHHGWRAKQNVESMYG